MSKYIGITLGPISRVTKAAKSTKALWASSYFFSYFAQCIIAPFKDRHFAYPVVNRDELWKSNDGIGCFPDRYVFQSEEGDFEILKTAIDDTLHVFSVNIAKTLIDARKKLVAPESVEQFLRNYIKVYCFEKETGACDFVNEFNEIFDLLELQDTYNREEKENYLSAFFESSTLYDSFLIEPAFGRVDKNEIYFQAIEKISCAELHECAGSKMPKMAYHKYIAIISADGDNMTETIGGLNEKGRSVTELSQMLFEYGQAVIPVAPDFGAKIIFSGGDDLKIFAPVKYCGKTVFDFVENISAIFNEKMEKLNAGSGLKLPTLSFGISITYKKFPMGEALAYSEQALSKAKYAPDSMKNAVVCRLQKHSGQTSELNLDKSCASYKKALNLLNLCVDNTLILNSLTYWYEKNKPTLSAILTSVDEAYREERVKAYMNNSLNESVHKTEVHAAIIESMAEYLCTCHEDSMKSQNEEKKRRSALNAIESTVALLRLIHFLNTKDKKEDEQHL